MVDNIWSEFQKVFTKEELSRFIINMSRGKLIITADVHGLSCNAAKRFLMNAINLVRCSFQLLVIHGYNHGTAVECQVKLTHFFV